MQHIFLFIKGQPNLALAKRYLKSIG